jgi:WD40 repeat protein
LVSAPFRLQFAPDGQRFAAVTESGGAFTVSVHDAMHGSVLVSHSFADAVLGFDWHPAGDCLAVADSGGIVHLMDSQTGQTRALGSHKAQAATVAFTPSGDYLFSGGWEGELIGWNMHTLRPALTINRHSWTVQFRADERECAVVTQSGIQLYSFVRPNYREFFQDLGPRLRRATFSADSRWLAAAADQYLGVWDLNSSGPGALLKAVDEASPMFVANGKGLIATGTRASPPRWRIIPPQNGAAPPTLEPGDSSSELLASTPAVPRAQLANLQESAPLVDPGSFEFQWPRTAQGINVISPDGRWLGAFGSFSPFLDIYRSPGMEPVARLRSCSFIGDFKFSPASDQVAVCSTSGIEFWNTDTWTRTRVLTNFTGILFSPKEQTWWLSADFRTAGLYKADTLKPLLALPAGILPIAISPDGRRLAVSVNSRFLQLWDLDDVRNQLRQCGLDWTMSSDEGLAASKKQRASTPL